jgi:sporulation-control protein
MSFFSKVLSKVGIGAAKIETELDNEQVTPGQQISGMITITGGNVEQQINKIELDVYCNYFVEEQHQEDDETLTRVIEKHCRINNLDIQDSFAIAPNHSKQIPFSLELSPHTPLSLGKSSCWIQTNLDIDCALDKADKDFLDVIPSPLQEATLNALVDLGFNMTDAENEACSSSERSLPFIQEFEFKARSGDFRGKLDELELVMFINDDTLDIYLQIDRRAQGIGGLFAEAFDLDESNVHLSVSADDIDQIADKLYAIIDAHC